MEMERKRDACLRSLAKSILCRIYKSSGLAWAQERLAYALGRRFMCVLLFHRVTDAISEDGLTLSTRRFRSICRMLRKEFVTVPLADVFDRLQSGKPIPRRTVAITFDDCYRDNLDAAAILKEHGLPATFFVPTAFVGTDEVFPWDKHLPRQRNLTWDDLRAMTAMGFEIGSHTVSHPSMGRISSEQALLEMVQSRQHIRQELGVPVRWFAYPYGGMNDSRADLLSLAEQAGYEGCLSGYGGFIFGGRNDRLLPREPVPYFQTRAHLELHLAGCLEWYYALRRRLGLLNNSRGQDQYPVRCESPLAAETGVLVDQG
jgi:peptidoglycan/xylan/chitin deacetylase (PgdA/CDA1 family)